MRQHPSRTVARATRTCYADHMARWNFGPKNGFWRGGRSLASNGYMLVRVGKEHHLADVRGYAYEHRVVAEKMLGRRLRAGEIVHHKNGQKADNRRANLEVLPTIAHHCAEHRSAASRDRLRRPGERNSRTACACGCGTIFEKFDGGGRPRMFVSGHNGRRVHQ